VLSNQADFGQLEAQESSRGRQGDQAISDAQAVLQRVAVEGDGLLDDAAAREANLAGRRARRLVRP
jgi:hypothetical protein